MEAKTADITLIFVNQYFPDSGAQTCEAVVALVSETVLNT